MLRTDVVTRIVELVSVVLRRCCYSTLYLRMKFFFVDDVVFPFDSSLPDRCVARCCLYFLYASCIFFLLS